MNSQLKHVTAGWLVTALSLLLWHGQLAAQPTADEYRLDSGDVLSITVFGEPDLSLQGVRVPVDGVISYPLIGDVRAGGETVKTIESKIAARLKDGYLLYPQVSVSIQKYRPFYVGGHVQNPGVQEYASDMTVGKAVALAGGLTERADEKRIVVQRYGKSESRAAEFSEVVYPGDVITVGEKDRATIEEEAAEHVFLYGEVNRPGRYEHFAGMTIEKAIATAGGFTPRASRRKIDIKREGDPPVQLSNVNLGTTVLGGDVITVGASIF
jgi:polysaccharide export outer membrane protein